ncbi:MAG: PTS fructose transporter subunit IIA [Caldibacillus debilis]|uniref:PTS sugar transporter subunit IIA n=1 Tax=Caldibacillus debilis TaxID=301148 RepID=UPI000E390BFA|nr:PTS sugar transporter subunit IIA [Caldibacillus debilis]REJ17617.1 MAG: PTS fructose transporter subunit IIA [Caldibacillus debilis]REJ31152.1 MAG: PTS fructose transporter subunit IIA [Caldibacillus debilis]
MIGFLICGHGFFAEGVYSSVQLISGKQSNIQIVNFLEGDSLERLKEKILTAISKLETENGIVCFTDLPGGTPFNVCSSLAASDANILVIGGINVPMLLSSLFIREKNLKEFADIVIKEGSENIKIFHAGLFNKKHYIEEYEEGI